MKKFNRIFGVGLTLALLASMLVVGMPTSAGTLSIGAETDIPSTTNYVLASGIVVADMDVNGSTIYATTGTSASNQTFKSTDGGKTWTVISTGTNYPALSTTAVATASDNANIVAVLASNNHIFYSSDAGSSWNDMGAIPNAATINDIAISPAASGVNYVGAVGTTTGGAGDLWILKLSIAQGWIQASSANGTPTDANMTKGIGMYGIAFSPAFGTDKIVLVVASNNAPASTYLEAFRDESGAYTWNGGISFFGATDWTNGSLLLNAGANFTTTQADIALPANYVGTQSGSRVAFVGTNAGVFRNTDSYNKQFTSWSGGPTGAIFSIAYNDAGKLVAGSSGTNTVYRSLSPYDTDPKFDRIPNFKSPGGANNVNVGYAGSTVVAATQGDESAFSMSADDGLTFNDISLINTTLTTWTDLNVSADGTVLYLASADNDGAGATDVSFWVKDTIWKRSFILMNAASGSAAFVIRQAPDDPNTVYVNQDNTNKMWMTNNKGLSSWSDVTVYKLGAIMDFQAQSASIVYAIDASGISKTTNGGSSWADKVPLSGTAGFMLTIAPNNDILVGGSDGSVAFSKDGGATFSQTKSAGSGNVYVTYDKDYATNNIIYAASGNSLTNAAVKRGKADTTSDWSARSPDVDFGTSSAFLPGGIIQTNGIVYVLFNSINNTAANETRVYRALSLTTATTSATAYWSYLATTTSNITGTPAGMDISVSSSVPKVWINLAAKGPYSFTDTIALVAPTQKAPTPGQIIQVNPGSGNPYNVTFSWSRYASEKVTNMELQIATDNAFNAVIFDATTDLSADPTGDTVARVVGPTTSPAASFNPGTTYYWRVRVSQKGPMYSPWSAASSFKIENPIPFNIVSPTPGANSVPVNTSFVWTAFPGATTYVWAISSTPDFSSPDTVQVRLTTTFYQPTTPLANSKTYYWRVKAITADNVETPWVNGIFSTAAPPTTQPTQPTSYPTPTITITIPPPVQPVPTSVLWAIVAIGAVLIIALIVLIVRTRRVA